MLFKGNKRKKRVAQFLACGDNNISGNGCRRGSRNSTWSHAFSAHLPSHHMLPQFFARFNCQGSLQLFSRSPPLVLRG